MNKFTLAVIFTSAAFGQEVDRTFKLTHVTTAPGLQEIATSVRTLGLINTVSIDQAVATLTVKGTSDQIAMVEWLVPRLDVAVNANGAQQYAIAGNPDDLLLVYGLAHTPAGTGIQEVITTLRTVANIQKVYNLSAPGIIALRGSSHDIAMAKFLLSELDQSAPPRQSAMVHLYQVSPGGTDTMMVYGLAHTLDSRKLQMIITTLRTVLDIQQIYNVSAPKLLAVRYRTRWPSSPDPGMIPVVQWLIGELDRDTPNSSANKMLMPGGSDDVVQVFYLTHVTAEPAIQTLLSTVRTASHTKAYQNFYPPALVLRGTADTIAMAGRTIEAADQPPAR